MAKKPVKPEKPRPDFPLFPHASQQWAKKIRGKLHYFGKWSDWSAAEQRYLDEKEYLQGGRRPPTAVLTIDELLGIFYGDKESQFREGVLSGVAVKEYKTTCNAILAHFGAKLAVETLTHEDFTKLRAALVKGKQGQTYAPATTKRRLTVARMIFALGSEQIRQPLPYKKPLLSPSKLVMRRRQREQGPRMYEARDIRKLVEAADPHLKAMVLLGINCGFGPKDCETLPASAITGDWLQHPRSKTEVDRRCPLWPETVAALAALPESDHVFNGRVWSRHEIARQFAELCKACEVANHGHYSLRRTFETVAATAEVNQAVIDAVMGHTRNDMASIYRQKIFDQQLQRCVNHVRAWYLGKVTLE
jgi:integrase